MLVLNLRRRPSPTTIYSEYWVKEISKKDHAGIQDTYVDLNLVPKTGKVERGWATQTKCGGKDRLLLPSAPLPLVIAREPLVRHAFDVDGTPQRRQRRRVRPLGCTRMDADPLLQEELHFAGLKGRSRPNSLVISPWQGLTNGDNGQRERDRCGKR